LNTAVKYTIPVALHHEINLGRSLSGFAIAFFVVDGKLFWGVQLNLSRLVKA
jgi:hypothetical protein